ncbi:effector-associated constant component EACC1 [Streptomyces sp. NPDC001220]
MHIRVATTAEDGHDTVSDLYRWLREDPDVRRHATVELMPSGRPGGAMGAVEIIDLVLSQGFSALNLAMSYAAWRTARPAAPPITITVTATDRPLTVDDASEETIRRIVQALQSTAGSDRDEEPGAAVEGAENSQ